MSKQKNKSDFKAKSMAEMQERGVLVVEILGSAAKMVLQALQLKPLMQANSFSFVGTQRKLQLVYKCWNVEPYRDLSDLL